MVARLGRLSELLDTIVSIYEKKIGGFKLLKSGNPAMKACGDLLPKQDYAYAQLKWKMYRIITSRHISQMIMLNKLKTAEILITIINTIHYVGLHLVYFNHVVFR